MKIIVYFKVPLAFGRETKWDTTSNTIDDGFAYACSLLKVQIKWTYYQTLDLVNSVSLEDGHKCMCHCGDIL